MGQKSDCLLFLQGQKKKLSGVLWETVSWFGFLLFSEWKSFRNSGGKATVLQRNGFCMTDGLSLIWLLLGNLSSSAKLNKCTGTVFQGLLISLLFDIVQYTIKISVEVKYDCSTEVSSPPPLPSPCSP